MSLIVIIASRSHDATNQDIFLFTIVNTKICIKFYWQMEAINNCLNSMVALFMFASQHGDYNMYSNFCYFNEPLISLYDHVEVIGAHLKPTK